MGILQALSTPAKIFPSMYHSRVMEMNYTKIFELWFLNQINTSQI